MKLRYLHLHHYPPLRAAQVAFSSDSPLQRECAIRFVVGINGSGKSHLLQALSEVFLALAEWRPPHFPVTLVYELSRDQRMTVVLSALRADDQAAPALWVSESYSAPADADCDDYEALIRALHANPEQPPHGFRAVIAPGAWSSQAAGAQLPYLPRTVLAYTTGALTPWHALWTRNADTTGVDLVSQDEDYDSSRERPVGWTLEQERQLTLTTAMRTGPASSAVRTEGDDTATADAEASKPANAWTPILLTPERLKFALLAVALPVGLQDIASDGVVSSDQHDTLRGLLQRAGWRWPLSVAVSVDYLHPELWSESKLRHLQKWFHAAGEVIAPPYPATTRTLHFDLRGPFEPAALPGDVDAPELRSLPDNSQGHALLALIGGEKNSSAYERFQHLCDLHREGLIADISLCLRKDDTEDAIRFDELSDGEQMVLGRMVLFHLLRDQQDALLLLDEPETHFNDKWKREIVDIIDDAIGDTANEVVISTHSAIVLSDVFNEEIVMVHKAEHGSELRPVEHKTFAADPSELMIRIFGADDSVGKRATEFIRAQLDKSNGSDHDIARIKALIERMGSGFYRSELRTLVNKWERPKAGHA